MKRNIKYYLANHKLSVATYIILTIAACAFSGISTILFSNFLSITISGQFVESLKYLIYAGVILVAQRFSWWISYIIYIRVSNKIWVEIAKDLTERSFQ